MVCLFQNISLRVEGLIVDAVRERCGDDFIIDVRISGSEYVEGANGLPEMIYVAKQLEKHSVNMLHVSGAAIPVGRNYKLFFEERFNNI